MTSLRRQQERREATVPHPPSTRSGRTRRPDRLKESFGSTHTETNRVLASVRDRERRRRPSPRHSCRSSQAKTPLLPGLLREPECAGRSATHAPARSGSSPSRMARTTRASSSASGSPPCRSATGSAGRRSSSCSAGLALDVGVQHRWLLRRRHPRRCRRQHRRDGSSPGASGSRRAAAACLLDLWCGGLIAFVALLVVDGGSNFALLLFLAVPFIAVVQIGWRRGFWLAVARGDLRGRGRADSALGRRDGDAARAGRSRRSPWRSCSRARSAARRRRTNAPRRAPSSSGRWRRRRITGSRTTCRRRPICCCSAVRTARTGRRSTRRPHASARSRPCTAC